MTVYPFEIDSDADLIRVDDNITEIGGEAINQLRDAVFAIEKELGIGPAGSAGSVASRLNTSLNADGSIKASALASVGLATLPISDSQVGINAGIKEYKLALDHSTSDLNTLIVSNTALLNALTAFTSATDSNLLTHIAGGNLLIDGSPARHVSSQIDLNQVPTDSRDPLFTWGGLFNKDGVQRSASNVTGALDQINTDLINHENATADAHVASAVNLDTDNFDEIPKTIDTVQKFVDHIDDFEVITIADHRATQHANCIPKIGRVYACDGYGQNVVTSTPVHTYLVRSPNITPVDSISNGDDIISFFPVDNSDFSFDAQFSQVRIGDDIIVNYGSGIETTFKVESIRFTPGSEWIVRINGVNLADSSDGYASARIDRPLFDRDTAGILAVAAANATPSGDFDTILQSVIVGHPRGAVALGNGFDAGQLDGYHYNLWLELYPTGNPADRVISLPAIDVTGNAGTTVGKYTLDSVVHETNKKLREIGYNYRFIAFADHGNFGIMLADAINCASFSITSGDISSGTLAVGSYSENVIGDAAATGFDALGLGNTHADLASPAYGATLVVSTAQLPTKVIVPFKSRDYIVDGKRRDDFAPTWLGTEDENGYYYWDGYISGKTVIGVFTVETTYTIPLNLKAAELKPGKTIVVQPAVALTDPLYYDVDYGRFIIKSVTFPTACPGDPDQTIITVISGIHAAGVGVTFSSGPPLPVRLYFSEDSVSFNDDNVIDSSPSGDKYHRLHEIFIDKNGKTFSHERSRMIVQGESLSPPLLRTGFGSGTWHIQDVSPKLRGYRDNNTTFNKYIRFYVLTYDTTSGEYTGYIGQRDPSSSAILKVGPVTTGRKNVPTRFYDETNVDYIDLIFVDDSPTSAGVPILTTAVARYVDIEVFDSLQLNDDIMLLATTEVNWDPVTGQEVIQRVVNRREFGSVDEEDFTESAIDFITAGDRALHGNGVLRGFDLDSIVVDEIFFKGGLSIVNGKVLTTNALSCTIPELHDNADPVPPPSLTVDWAVCVNEEGFLEPVLITATKYQFWARDNTSGSTYYVPSVTFTELLNTRKDLTPISIVTATIGSITINPSDVADVRRFVDSNDTSDLLVLSRNDYIGSFHTITALKNYLIHQPEHLDSPFRVRIRGPVDLDQDWTFGSSTPVIFEGDGGVVNVTATATLSDITFKDLDVHISSSETITVTDFTMIGGSVTSTAPQPIIVSDNVVFDGVDFTYNPTGITYPIAGDLINQDNGCIFSEGNTSFENVTIQNCVFTSTISGQRPPFISFKKRSGFSSGYTINGLFIRNNKFNDDAAAENMAAISIMETSPVAAGVEPAILYNCRIENNTCDRIQGIWITKIEFSPENLTGHALIVYDTIVSGNNCGIIGFVTSPGDTTSTIVANKQTGLIIENNAANVIGNFANPESDGTSVVVGSRLGNSTTPSFPSGSVHIKGNDTNCIILRHTDIDTSDGQFSRKIIEGNKITAVDYTFLDKFTDTSHTGSFQNSVYGIEVGTQTHPTGWSGVDLDDVLVMNNILTAGGSISGGNDQYFDIGIAAPTSCSIAGNTIRGIVIGGEGINVEAGTGAYHYWSVRGNKIYRDGRSISFYIHLEGTAASGGGIVVDNWFDDYDVGSGSDETISGTGSSPSLTYADTWVIERNKNQTARMLLAGHSAAATFGASRYYPDPGISNLQVNGAANSPTGSYVCRVAASGGATASTDVNFWWDLDVIIPAGARFVSCEARVVASTNIGNGTAKFTLHQIGKVAVDSVPVVDLTSAGTTQTVLTAPDTSYVSRINGITLELDINNIVLNVSGAAAEVLYLYINYRW